MLTRTVFGRYIYAVGSNPESARLAGVPVPGHRVGLRDLRHPGRVGRRAADLPAGCRHPHAGTGFELNAIAACVIGGASLFGAKGSALGAATGALIMGVLNNGGNLLAINAFYLQIAIGVLILVAVGFDQLNTRKTGAWLACRSAAEVRAGRASRGGSSTDEKKQVSDTVAGLRYATERLARDALAEIQNGMVSGTVVSRSTLTVE